MHYSFNTLFLQKQLFCLRQAIAILSSQAGHRRPLRRGLNMRIHANILRKISELNDNIGKCLCWLAGLMAVVVVGVVSLRTFFNTGSIAAQESVTYMHAAMFLLCLTYTAKNDGHVRVDIFYRKWGNTGKDWVNLFGTLIFLLPFAIFLTIISWPFAVDSWSIAESSINPGGIPAVFLLKTLIPLSGLLLCVYGIAEAIYYVMKITMITDSNTQ